MNIDQIPSTVHIYCYDLSPKTLGQKTTLVLSNTQELDRVLSTMYLPIYTN